MSDRIVQSCHDGDGRAGQSMRSYQSVWMAHWTRTSCKEAPPDDNRVSLHLENKDDSNSNKHHLPSDLERASDISPSVKGFTEVTEPRTVRIVNDGLTNSKNMIDEQLDSQQFPMFRVSQNSGLDSKNDLDISHHKQVSRPQIDCNVEYNACTTAGHFPSVLAVAPSAIESSPREFQYEGVSLSPEGLVKSPKVVGDGGLALAGPQNNFIGSTQMVPYRSEKGKTPVSSSFMSRLVSKEHLSNTNFTTLEHEHDNYLGHPALLVCGKKVDNHSTSVKSGTSFLRQTNASRLLQDNYHLPMLVERCQKMQNCSSTGFFPSCSNPPEAMIANSIHDVETLRICATNSVEGLSGDPGAFSQTTRSLLFMKKTDVNLSEENQTFRESRVSSKLNRNMFGELLTLSPPLAQNQQRLKLQPLGSSTECEGKDNVEGVETSEVRSKNESSAETDTMDTDAFKDHNYLSGISSSPSNKDFLMGQNPPSQPTITSTGVKVGHRSELPDINEEILALPTTLNSMDNAEASTSRTQSLDAELLLSHTEHPSKAKSIPYPDDEASNRWLKRLKLTASASDRFVLGTKSSNLGEAALSHEKVNKLFIKSLEGCKSSNSEPMVRKYHDKEKMATDQTTIVLRNGEPSSVESTKKDRDILLSHPWIQRWCDNRAATRQKKVVCEPQSTKMEFDELRRKQFPSVAAMALMGKAMSGFQPCEFQQRGSFIVWNTKLF